MRMDGTRLGTSSISERMQYTFKTKFVLTLICPFIILLGTYIDVEEVWSTLLSSCDVLKDFQKCIFLLIVMDFIVVSSRWEFRDFANVIQTLLKGTCLYPWFALSRFSVVGHQIAHHYLFWAQMLFPSRPEGIRPHAFCSFHYDRDSKDSSEIFRCSCATFQKSCPKLVIDHVLSDAWQKC